MRPIPVYLKNEQNTPRPSDPEFYWITRNGIFFCRNHAFFASDVPARLPLRALDSHQSSCHARYPRLSAAALEFIVGFFDRIYTTHNGESIVLVYWDSVRQQYKLRVPEQEATVWESYSGYRTALDVAYTVPIDVPAHQLLVADIHCHCDFGAACSLTDERDEKYRDGMHVIVGHIDREPPEFNVVFSVDGFRFRMPFDELFAGYSKRRHVVPRRWLDQVSVKVNRPQSTWSDAPRGQQQRGWNTNSGYGYGSNQGYGNT